MGEGVLLCKEIRDYYWRKTLIVKWLDMNEITANKAYVKPEVWAFLVEVERGFGVSQFASEKTGCAGTLEYDAERDNYDI